MSSATSRNLGKLFALKHWVELEEAARYLSILIGEEANRDDLLRLGLDGHLTLSVRFTSATSARCGRTIPLAEAKRHEIPTLEGDGFFVCIEGTVIPGERVIVFEEQVTTIVDLWDLPMLGGDRLEVENLYERARWREAPELFNMEGSFVVSPDGLYCQLLDRFEERRGPPNKPYHPDNYYPAAGLPDDSVIVVRTEALRQFASRLSDESEVEAKPLERRERATLLTIVAALAKLAKVDLSKPSKAAVAIESETALMGARVAARTIENHLKRIPEALEAKET
jgi:hypothetical protein